MKKIGIFYGSSSGTTADVAERIGKELGVPSSQIKDVSKASADDFDAYDVLLLGTSTWGDGDLHDDWYDLVDDLKKKDFTGKQISFFGCGDCESYPETFCGAMGTLYEDLKGTGATFIGSVDLDGYDYEDSQAIIDGVFIGLPIDEDNQDDLTDTRIANWVEELKSHF